jgi:hypothetical protein
LRTPSLQVAEIHVPARQRLETQSPNQRQADPSGQAEQLPPQSTAASSPFFVSSLQPAARQFAATQTSDRQSLGAAQASPFGH